METTNNLQKKKTNRKKKKISHNCIFCSLLDARTHIHTRANEQAIRQTRTNHKLVSIRRQQHKLCNEFVENICKMLICPVRKILFSVLLFNLLLLSFYFAKNQTEKKIEKKNSKNMNKREAHKLSHLCENVFEILFKELKLGFTVEMHMIHKKNKKYSDFFLLNLFFSFK